MDLLLGLQDGHTQWPSNTWLTHDRQNQGHNTDGRKTIEQVGELVNWKYIETRSNAFSKGQPQQKKNELRPAQHVKKKKKHFKKNSGALARIGLGKKVKSVHQDWL